MTNRISSALVAILLGLLIGVPSNAQTYIPTSENLASREAFRADRFGIFIHWGIYSMLATGEWTLQIENLNYQEYSKLAGGFYPSKFDAAQWVSSIKESGAKYITITSRHHDGFSMFGTELSDFNVVSGSPFGRDILKELAQECEKQGIALHFYYSLIDWTRVDAPRGETGNKLGRPTDTVDEESYFNFMKGQLRELLSYGPAVRCIWFDGHWDQRPNPDFNWHYDELYDLIHELRPDVLVGNNHHLLPFPGEDIQIFERDLPGENKGGYSEGQEVSQSLPLETCETTNYTWGYNIKDRSFKDVPTLVKLLVSAAGKDANLLLNIGPQPDGMFPAQAYESLKGIGEWMAQYGHTVQGTRGGELEPQEWGVMTRTGNKRYVHILSLDAQELSFEFAKKIKSAVCLNDGSAVKYTQKNGVVTLSLTEACREIDYIVELTIK